MSRSCGGWGSLSTSLAVALFLAPIGFAGRGVGSLRDQLVRDPSGGILIGPDVQVVADAPGFRGGGADAERGQPRQHGAEVVHLDGDVLDAGSPPLAQAPAPRLGIPD